VDLLVYDDEDKRYVPALVALGGALLVALVIGTLAFFLGRTPPAEPVGGVTSPQAGSQQPSSCQAALEQAEAALTLATRLETALREQTSVMDELLARRLTQEQALDRALPPLTAGAKDRQAFLDAVTTYRQAREACQQ
jgi:hypothetical protein